MRQLYFFILLALISTITNAQNTYVPDDNFEQALIDSGYDTGALDDYVSTAIISNITWLDVHDKGISDLTGIEDFTSLLVLDVSENNLTSLDVSNNVSLINILCYSNSLTSIDVSNNNVLTHLLCYKNNLSNIDVSNNTVLNTLYVGENNLTTLDVSNNTALTNFSCHTNSLTNLDVSNNILLDYLWCHSNNLTRLNLSNNQLLDFLSCSNNELIGLNLKNLKNSNVVFFSADSNPDLECIQVDDPAYCEANWTNIDPTSSYRKNCRYNANYSRQGSIDLESESYSNQKFSMYPNPVHDVMTISSKTNGHFSIVDINGQVLKQGVLMKGKTEIDLSQLEQGLYFLSVTSETDSKSKKIIKN